jgi:hypothetical protein
MPAVTLADLVKDGIGLRACCDRCGYSRTLDPAPLAERFGGERTVPSFRGALRCTRCGSRETSAQPDYPYVEPQHRDLK